MYKQQDTKHQVNLIFVIENNRIYAVTPNNTVRSFHAFGLDRTARSAKVHSGGIRM
jgi:hypothetical protein